MHRNNEQYEQSHTPILNRKDRKAVFIDGDGCSQATRVLAERLVNRGVSVIIAADRTIPLTHTLTQMHICDKCTDAADTFIYEHCKDGDLVITRDLALAKKLLANTDRRIYVMSDSGELYHLETIDARIMRSEHSKERRGLTSSFIDLDLPKSNRSLYALSGYTNHTKSSKNIKSATKKKHTVHNTVADYLEKWRLGLL